VTQPAAERRRSDGWTGRPRRALVTLVVVLTVVADQMVKVAIRQWIGPASNAHRWEVAGPILAFEYVENRGAAFGLFAGQTEVLVIAALGAAIILTGALIRLAAQSTLVALGLGLVGGGALGNLIDRVRLGYVVDFVAVGVWPKFNIADIAITIGLLLLGWYAVNGQDHKR
jgi:signal peptidase II